MIALAFCVALSSCIKENDNTPAKSTWESRTEAGNLILTFIDESRCSITTGSGKPGAYDANFEVFDYSLWFGPRWVSLYSRGDTESPRYLAKYSDETHLLLVPIRDAEEVESDALVLYRR